MGKEAVFFDRDGIIVQNIANEAPQNPSDLCLIPESISLLRQTKKMGYLNIIVSNQPDTALGHIREETRKLLENKFRDLINENQLPIDAIYFCYHHPNALLRKYAIDCDCRKPKPGMLFRAAREHIIDLQKSFIIGDRASDIKAGNLAKVQTILYDKNNTQGKYLKEHQVQPDYTVTDLSDIMPLIAKNSSLTFQAMILAAGRGERMLPLTGNTPKPLLKIAGKPLMEYTVDALVAHGASEIGINLSYLGKQIEDHFGDGAKFGVHIKYVWEDELSGTAGGIKKISYLLKPKKPFFVLVPDVLNNFDLKKIYNFHQNHNGIATICCYWRSKENLAIKKSGLVLYDESTYLIKKIVERPQTEDEIISQWVNSSVYVFDPKILDYIPDQINGSKIIDLPKHIFPSLLKQGEKIYAFPVDYKKYYQLGIDTPDRLLKAEKDIRSKKFIPL